MHCNVSSAHRGFKSVRLRVRPDGEARAATRTVRLGPVSTPADPEDTARIVAFAMDLARAGETELLRRYVTGGFPVNHPDPDGNTVLMLAAYHGHPGTVSMLIAAGADVDRTNSRGQSPLAGAIFKAEDEVAALLVTAGADPDAGRPSARATAAMFGRDELLHASPGAGEHRTNLE